MFLFLNLHNFYICWPETLRNFRKKLMNGFYLEAVVQRCSVKKVFREISQNSQKNTCVRVSFSIKLQVLLKKKLWHRCFPVNFAKFLRAPFITEHLWWLLLFIKGRETSMMPKDLPLKIWTNNPDLMKNTISVEWILILSGK